jgi:DNA polymerase-3 subunit delta
MILKSIDAFKINLKKNKLVLFYGKNEGLKKETIRKLIGNTNKVSNYEEKEILDNQNDFFEDILSRSLFENEKIIVIKRATDKIVKLINELGEKNVNDIIIIINSDNLEKKSKLRSLFEKNKEYVCVAFYPDNTQTLSKLTYNFFREKNLSISQANINLIVNKCNGDRETLLNEITKIENFSFNGKKITSENIAKLTNLVENHSISELIDNCLAKNKKKLFIF